MAHPIKTVVLSSLIGFLIITKTQAVEVVSTPETKAMEAMALARSNASSNPMNWRAVNALGMTLFQARKYTEAALAFEQAITMFPISSAAETEQQAKEARQLAYKTQKDADEKMQKQQKEAQEQMQEQQMLSGMLSMMPMMPGANQSTMMLSQAGQTMLNVAMVPEGMSILSGQMLPENESSQVLKARELSTLYSNLGQVRMALWEDDTALEAFRQAYATDPSRTDLIFIQATILQRDDDMASAISLYARYMVLAPETKQPITWVEIAECCRDLGLESEMRNALTAARKTWDRILGQNTTPKTEHGYGEILAAAGFYKEAIPHLQIWINSSPNDLPSQREWAIALFRAGKMEDALKVMKIYTKDPKTALSDGGFSTYFTGLIELHLGNVKEAKKILGTLHPVPGATSGFAVAAYAISGHLDETKEWIDRVENGLSSPETASVDYYRLGCVWLVAGNFPKAAECVSRSIELEPQFGPSLLLREQLLKINSERIKSEQTKVSKAVSNGDITSAVQTLSLLLSIMPNSDSSNALALEGMKYVSNLQSPLRMAKESQQYYLRAQAILKNAKGQEAIKEAIGQYKWALRYSPLSPEIHLGLSSAYAIQKQFKKALLHIQLCLTASQPSGNIDAIIERYYELQYLNGNELRKISAVIPKNN